VIVNEVAHNEQALGSRGNENSLCPNHLRTKVKIYSATVNWRLAGFTNSGCYNHSSSTWTQQCFGV